MWGGERERGPILPVHHSGRRPRWRRMLRPPLVSLLRQWGGWRRRRRVSSQSVDDSGRRPGWRRRIISRMTVCEEEEEGGEERGDGGWSRHWCASLVGGGVSGVGVLWLGFGGCRVKGSSTLSVKEPTRQGPGGVFGRGGQPLPKCSRTSFPSVVSLLSFTLWVRVGSLP